MMMMTTTTTMMMMIIIVINSFTRQCFRKSTRRSYSQGYKRDNKKLKYTTKDYVKLC